MIIEVDELIDYMSNITLSADQREAAELVIEGAQAEVETYLGRPIERIQRTETLMPDHNGYVWPFATPISSVLSISDPTVPVVGDEVPTTPALPGTGLLWRHGYSGPNGIYVGGFGYGGPVTVTYIGGLNPAGVPAAKLTVLRVAAREMENRHDDTLSVRDLTTERQDPNPIGLQPEDEKRLERWRHRTVVSG